MTVIFEDLNHTQVVIVRKVLKKYGYKPYADYDVITKPKDRHKEKNFTTIYASYRYDVTMTNPEQGIMAKLQVLTDQPYLYQVKNKRKLS